MRPKIPHLIAIMCAIALPFTTCAAAESTPSPASGVTYEIFVASFNDHNGDGCGDLLGIVDKLDYLTSLGVDTLWLMPIHPSPSYHKYDVTDYDTIDPAYGTLEDFEALIAACQERGIAVMLDLVVNHTSNQHPWFQAACKALAAGTDSPYTSWYNFTQTPGDGYHAVPGADGKLTPAAIADAAAQHCAQPGIYDEHMVLPRMAYISDATELGTVYTKAELTALRAACDAHGLYLYLDGARLAQALTAAGNDLRPEDLPQLCDAFYIGGTKNGLLFGEAMVIVNDALKPGFRRAMKRSGAMLAKGRLLGVQFAAALEQDLWLDMGRHANAQAQRIAAALSNLGVPMYVPSPTNQIFPILPDAKIAQLQERAAFYTNTRVDETHQAVRFVTSWATTDAQVDALLALLNEVLG